MHEECGAECVIREREVGDRAVASRHLLSVGMRLDLLCVSGLWTDSHITDIESYQREELQRGER